MEEKRRKTEISDERLTLDPGESPDTGLVLDTAMEAGHILLENGAEISRVEDTMRRISAYYGVREEEFFILSNGIFTTGGSSSDRRFAKVEHIPVQGTRLDKVVAVNQLSREICAGDCSLESARRRLAEIRKLPGKKPLTRIAASGLGSASFCCLFGGDLADCAASLIAGLVLYVFIVLAEHRLSKLLLNLLGGALVTFLCVVFHHLGFGHDISYMIIGSIIPLVPGVSFVNGIRDITDGDYLSGAVRILDVTLVLMGIAIGVSAVLTYANVLL
ncbi:MAG: threonine/serine exporter family protein [Lachnospiraceae bacterium]|nr:threonine/serine exporter family protein [Lachnospiraceae bacterium]